MRLLLDNGVAFISGEFRAYLEDRGMTHTRGKPCHPMTQGKIERYHRMLKNVITLQNFFLHRELDREIATFVAYYNHRRVHEALRNLTPADVYCGRAKDIRTARERIKRQILRRRRRINQGLPVTPKERILPALYRNEVSSTLESGSSHFS